MPELPEVETITRELREGGLIGVRILKAEVFWPRTIAEPSLTDFCSRIINQKICSINRRGKYIVFGLSHDTLLIHLRMTGKFTLSKGIHKRSSHERVRLQLDNGYVLHYEDQRKFGRWHLLRCPEALLSRLGLEPLSDQFTLKAFENLTRGHSQQIKPFLLDQRHIAGLGNIYVDEALWEAEVHPAEKTNLLTSAKISALFHAIPKVLEQGIANMGTSLGSKQANYFSVSGRRGGNQHQLNVFRRDGLKCPRCCTKIIKIKIAQRGTHICPFCQILTEETVWSTR